MKIAKNFILREIASEAILVPTGSAAKDFNGMINISETGKFIWEHIESANSFDDLISRILSEYDVDKDTAINETTEFINELLRNGLIEFTNEDKTW